MKMMGFIFILVLGTSCAAKKLAVKNADSLLEHQLEKRMPLTSKQEQVLSSDIDLFLRNSKPRGLELIYLVDKISLEEPELLETRYTEMMEFVKKVSLDFFKVIAKHMAHLDAKQQEEFIANLKAENKKLKKNGDNQKVFEERFKAFFGSINSIQDDLYKEYKAYFQQHFQEKIYRRENLRRTLRTIYAEEKSPEALEIKFIEAFAAYQARPYENEKSLEIIRKLVPTLTLEQKNHFRETIREFKELIRYFLETDY